MSKMQRNISKLFILEASLLMVLFLPFMVLAQVFDTAVELHGYAWSGYDQDNNGSVDGGIGWISFNCDNDSSCAADAGNGLWSDYVDYSVEINPDYTLTGYAWSSNIGWIKFGGLGTPPSYDIDNDSTARINASRTELEGWARACSVFQSGCSGSLKSDSERGGWDGWLSLSSVNTGGSVSYSVSVGTGVFDSYAWGDEIFGWVDFKGVAHQTTFDVPCDTAALKYCSIDSSQVLSYDPWCQSVVIDNCDTGAGSYCSIDSNLCLVPAPIVMTSILTVDKPFVRENDTVVVSWEVDPTTADECTVMDSQGNNLETAPGLSGPATSNPITREETVFTLSCKPTGFDFYVEVATATTTKLFNIREI